MKARSKLLLVAFIAACTSLFFLGRAYKTTLPPEPTFEGKPLSFWLQALTKHDLYNWNPHPESSNAVRQIGPAAVPFLIQWFPKPQAPGSPLARLFRRVPLIGDALAPRPSPPAPVNSDAIIRAFWVLGPKANSALPHLASILTNAPLAIVSGAWHCASEAVPHIGPEALPVMLVAVTNLQARGVHQRWELIKNIGILTSNAVSAIPALIAWTTDQDSWVRLGAVNALGEIAEQSEIVVPVLRRTLHDTDDLVRRDSAEAIGTYGPVALPDLLQALTDPVDQVRGGAMHGFGKVAIARPEIVLPILKQGLYDRSDFVRRSAAYGLGYSGSKAAFEILMAATNAGVGDIIYQIRSTVRPEDLH